MLEYTTDELTECLALAHQPNSALKNFLKQEVQKGDPVAKFVKALKGVLAKKKKEAISEFVNKYHEKYQAPFFVLSRYLHSVPLGEVAEGIVDKYADEFNETYETSGDSITVKNDAEFMRIVKDAVAQIESGLSERDLPSTPFMKNLLIDWIFDEAVAKEVFERISK